MHVPPLNKPYTAEELSNGLQLIIKSILENEEIDSNEIVRVKV